MNRFNFGSCLERTKNKSIICEERNRKFIGLNRKEKFIIKVEVDGCLESKEKRCDWLLIVEENNIAYFIELKGSEVRHAVEQLKFSIKLISNTSNNYIKDIFAKINAYIVTSRFPKESAFIQREKKSFLKKYKAKLVVKNKEVREIL